MIIQHRYWFHGFLALLMLPLILLVASPRTTVSKAENRILATFPDQPRSLEQWQAYPGLVSKFLSDQFPYRTRIVRVVAQLRYMAGATNRSVVVGSDGWLFYTGDDVIAQVTGRKIDSVRLRVMADFVADLYHRAAQQKIRFLFTIAPNKHTIYRDKMPNTMQPIPTHQERTLLMKLMVERNVPVLDLVPILQRARKSNQVYWQTDTHWNELGATVAFNAILDAFGMNQATIEIRSELITYNSIDYSGDLARMLGMGGLLTEPWLLYRPKALDLKIVKETKLPLTGYILKRYKPGPTILVIGDSFSEVPYKRLLSNVAGKVIFMHHVQCKFDASAVFNYQPDLILYQTAERSIGCDSIDR